MLLNSRPFPNKQFFKHMVIFQTVQKNSSGSVSVASYHSFIASFILFIY